MRKRSKKKKKAATTEQTASAPAAGTTIDPEVGEAVDRDQMSE